MTGKGIKATSLDAVPPESMATFAGERADLPLSLARRPRGGPEARGPRSRVSEARAAADSGAGRHGTRRHQGGHGRRWPAISSRMQTELDELTSAIYGHAGGEFNINSPKQLGDVLFTKLNLQSAKKTGKTRAISTAQDVLEELALGARTAGARPEVAQHSETEGHLRRRAADAREPGDRTRAHDVQPGGGGHRPAEQQRSESAEHSGAHAARPRDSGGVRRRARARPDFRGLLADRTARARASLGRRRAGRGVSPGHRHPRSHGRSRVRIGERPRRARAAAPREDHQLRAALRQDGVHAGQGHRRARSRPRRNSSTPTSPASPACARTSISTLADARQIRRRPHAHGPPAARAGTDVARTA